MIRPTHGARGPSGQLAFVLGNALQSTLANFHPPCSALHPARRLWAVHRAPHADHRVYVGTPTGIASSGARRHLAWAVATYARRCTAVLSVPGAPSHGLSDCLLEVVTQVLACRTPPPQTSSNSMSPPAISLAAPWRRWPMRATLHQHNVGHSVFHDALRVLCWGHRVCFCARRSRSAWKSPGRPQFAGQETEVAPSLE